MGWDAGVVQDLIGRRLSLGATYFHNRVKSLIDFDPGPPPRLVNRSATISHGVELTVNWQVTPELTAVGQLTYTRSYTRSAVDDSDQPLRNRPK